MAKADEWRFERVDQSGQGFALVPSCASLTAGRSRECDVMVVHPSISRHHARLFREGDGLFVEDLGSTNGVSVNGERVTAARAISPGDLVTLGEVAYRASLREPERPALATVQAAGPQRVRRLETILEMSKLINSSLVPAKVLERVMEAVMTLSSAERGLLMIAGEDGQLACRVERNLRETIAEGGRTSVSMSAVRQAFAEGRSLVSVDVDRDGRMAGRESVLRLRLKSVMVVPLRHHETVIGVIYVDSRRAVRGFTEEDLRVLEALADHAAIAIANARLVEESNEMLMSTIEALAEAIEKRDSYTGGHTRRVLELSLAIGAEMSLGEEDRQNLRMAAVLHDIGKIGVEDRVLLKQGPLVGEEQRQIKRHPELGGDIVNHIRRLQKALPGILLHHEKIDGTGYPFGYAGERIPLIARIIAVADCVDAMMTDRPYRKGLPRAAVLKELAACSGTQFDPAVAAAAVTILGRGAATR